MSTATISPPVAGIDLSESLYEVVDGNTVQKPFMGARENGLAFLLAMQIATNRAGLAGDVVRIPTVARSSKAAGRVIRFRSALACR